MWVRKSNRSPQSKSEMAPTPSKSHQKIPTFSSLPSASGYLRIWESVEGSRKVWLVCHVARSGPLEKARKTCGRFQTICAPRVLCIAEWHLSLHPTEWCQICTRMEPDFLFGQGPSRRGAGKENDRLFFLHSPLAHVKGLDWSKQKIFIQCVNSLRMNICHVGR